MPKRTSLGPWQLALHRGLFAAVTVALVACESTPCVGDACPDACNGVACDEEAALDGGTTTGRFTPCGSNANCDQASGFECVGGTCRHPCNSHFDCGGVAICEPFQESGTFCALTSPPTEPGGYYSHCPNGDECDEERGFVCIGAGVGDTESYCSLDCTSDDECPEGYLCDVVGAAGSERKVCVPRGFCATCESDADCLSLPGGVCARDENGEKWCSTLCDPSRNSCPWGTATECRVTDRELGVPTCQHRSGSCRGEGLGCDPCVRDDDCPGGFCLVSTYTGERWCVDQASPCTCAGLSVFQDFCAGASTTCARSPSGQQMICYDPGASGGGACIGINLPSSSGSNQLSCWR